MRPARVICVGQRSAMLHPATGARRRLASSGGRMVPLPCLRTHGLCDTAALWRSFRSRCR
jgi:hypothetical protein